MTTTSLLDAASRRPVVTLGALILLALGLRLAMYRGYVGLDDAEYSRLAYELAHGDFHPTAYSGPPVFPLRIGIIAPTAGAYRVLGFGEWQMLFYPLLISVASIALAYVCATWLFGARAGPVAGFLYAVLPQDVELSTKLLPDLPAAFTAAAGVTIVLLLLRRRMSARALALGGLVAGLCFGLSWLHKEAIAYVAPFMILVMSMSLWVERRAVLPLWVGTAIGSLAVLVAEASVYGALTGDPLHRFHEIERNYAVLENGFFTEGSDLGWSEDESYVGALARRLFVTGPHVLLLNPVMLYLPLAGLVAAVFGWKTRDEAFLLPSLWLLTLLLMFNFASSSTDSYLPLAITPGSRYVFSVAFPAVVLAAGLIGRQTHALDAAIRARRLSPATLPVVAVLGVVVLSGAWQYQYPVRHLDEVRAWTAEVRAVSDDVEPQTLLYSDTLSLRGLSFFAAYPDTVRWVDFARLPPGASPDPNSLVLVNHAYIEWLQVNAGMWLSPPEGYRTHMFYHAAPESWTVLWSNENATLYRVPPGSDDGSP